MGIATLGGAVLMLLLGYAYSRSHPDAYGTASGALIVLTGVLMAISTIAKVDPVNLMWAITFGVGILAVVVQAYRYAKNGSSVAAGLLVALIAVCAVAALYGAMFVSTAMAVAFFAGLLVISLHK